MKRLVSIALVLLFAIAFVSPVAAETSDDERIAELEAEVEELEEGNARLKEKNGQLSERNKELREKSDERGKRINKQKEEIKQLTDRVAQLEQQAQQAPVANDPAPDPVDDSSGYISSVRIDATNLSASAAYVNNEVERFGATGEGDAAGVVREFVYWQNLYLAWEGTFAPNGYANLHNLWLNILGTFAVAGLELEYAFTTGVTTGIDTATDMFYAAWYSLDADLLPQLQVL